MSVKNCQKEFVRQSRTKGKVVAILDNPGFWWL